MTYRAEEPEETRGEGEENTQPDRDIDTVAKGSVDVVLRQRVVERAGQNGVENCRCEGEADKEEGADTRHDGSC